MFVYELFPFNVENKIIFMQRETKLTTLVRPSCFIGVISLQCGEKNHFVQSPYKITYIACSQIYYISFPNMRTRFESNNF